MTPLVVGMAVVVLGLLAVLTDASAAFLARRALSAAADGAALYAAGGVDRAALYTTGVDGLRISPRDATARAGTYLQESGVLRRCPDARVVAVHVAPSGTAVTVAIRATAVLPFRGVFTGTGGILPVDATASAELPLRR